MNCRFSLEWVLRPESRLMTHVILYDAERHPDHLLASGHGADDPHALMDLWATLVDQNDQAEAIAFVADVHTRLTGNRPERALK